MPEKRDADGLKLNATQKADLMHAYQRTIQRCVSLLTAVQSDLQVLGSEFSPDLHQLNTQLDALCQKMQQHDLDDQSNDNGAPAEKPGAPSDQA